MDPALLEGPEEVLTDAPVGSPPFILSPPDVSMGPSASPNPTPSNLKSMTASELSQLGLRTLQDLLNASKDMMTLLSKDRTPTGANSHTEGMPGFVQVADIDSAKQKYLTNLALLKDLLGQICDRNAETGNNNEEDEDSKKKLEALREEKAKWTKIVALDNKMLEAIIQRYRNVRWNVLDLPHEGVGQG